ncbi:MAG TPA: nucleotidyltransferase family protein [Candidatus Paceibacterota bacterium]|nr:nucleotidyltransferase family protein [Candidatus Paceibacterota bacterium]
MIAQEITKKMEPVLKKHDVSFAGIFGSRARGEERTDSDVDLLVRFNKQKGLFELAGLERDLSESLNLKVDLVTEGGLSPLLKSEVMKDLQPIYGQR